MEPRILIAVLLLLAFGVYFGRKLAQISESVATIRGGQTARMLHFLACCIMAMLVPSILAEVFVFRLGTISVVFSIGLVGIAFLLLIGYAALELPARERASLEEDRGWTAQDAKASGL